MKKNRIEHIGLILDCLFIALCVVAIGLNMFYGNCTKLSNAIGIFGGFYIFLILLVFAFRRTFFDWHIINGGMLRKVICISILVPFVVAALISLQCEPIQPNELISHIDKWDNDTVKYEEENVLWTIFVHYVDPGLQINALQECDARRWTGAVAILGLIFLNGLLITSIINWVDKRRELWQKGIVKYPWSMSFYRHYVIIGGNDMVGGIVRQIFDKEKETNFFRWGYILIQTSRDVELFRRELFSTLSPNEQRKIIIYYGSRTSATDIESLKLKNAKEVYLLGEDSRTDDLESYHDTLNMKCLRLLWKSYIVTSNGEKIKILRNEIECIKAKGVQDENTKSIVKAKENEIKALRILCRVMFEYQATFTVFQFSEISKELKDYINFKPFNYYETWAQKVLITRQLAGVSYYAPLEGCYGIDESSPEYVHLVIVGMSRMGTAMATEAAHLAHYPNFVKSGIRTKITFIDENAAREKDCFVGRYKDLFSLSHWRYGEFSKEDKAFVWTESSSPKGLEHLGGDFLDIEWEFINGGLEQEFVQDYILQSSRLTPKMTIALCVPEASKCLAQGLYLNREIYKNVLQILVYNRLDDAIVKEMIFDSDSNQYNPFENKIKAFGMASSCYDAEYIEQAEFIAAELDEEYRLIYNELKENDKIKDEGSGKGKSAVAGWWSNIYSANMLWTKLRCVHFSGGKLTDQQLDLMAKVEHNRWNMEQLLMRCRPLNAKEQEEIVGDRTQKNVYKGKMAHLDICSNNRLVEIDPNVIAYDKGFSKALPRIYNKLQN